MRHRTVWRTWKWSNRSMRAWSILKAKNEGLFTPIVATNVDELSSELSAHSQLLDGFAHDEHFKGSDTFVDGRQESSRRASKRSASWLRSSSRIKACRCSYLPAASLGSLGIVSTALVRARAVSRIRAWRP